MCYFGFATSRTTFDSVRYGLAHDNLPNLSDVQIEVKSDGCRDAFWYLLIQFAGLLALSLCRVKFKDQSFVPALICPIARCSL